MKSCHGSRPSPGRSLAAIRLGSISTRAVGQVGDLNSCPHALCGPGAEAARRDPPPHQRGPGGSSPSRVQVRVRVEVRVDGATAPPKVRCSCFLGWTVSPPELVAPSSGPYTLVRSTDSNSGRLGRPAPGGASGGRKSLSPSPLTRTGPGAWPAPGSEFTHQFQWLATMGQVAGGCLIGLRVSRSIFAIEMNLARC